MVATTFVADAELPKCVVPEHGQTSVHSSAVAVTGYDHNVESFAHIDMHDDAVHELNVSDVGTCPKVPTESLENVEQKGRIVALAYKMAMDPENAKAKPDNENRVTADDSASDTAKAAEQTANTEQPDTGEDSVPAARPEWPDCNGRAQEATRALQCMYECYAPYIYICICS